MDYYSKRQKEIRITNAFQGSLDYLNRKPNKILLGKANKFYNRSVKYWQEKFVIAERLVRNFKMKSLNRWIQYQKYQNIFIWIN